MARDAGAEATGPEKIIAHYASGYEGKRLFGDSGQIERERTRDMLARLMPPAPAVVLDIGGGPGGHACWLAARGYQVHLIDIVPLHVEMAREASARQPQAPLAGAEVGDARSLSWASGTVNAALLLGPLYHLTAEEDRLQALREAHRVLVPGGVLLAAGISRYASLLDGLRHGYLKDPTFAKIVEQDLQNGQHRNPTNHPDYFMDTFFTHPEELRREVAAAGFRVEGLYGIEGPTWLAPDLPAWRRDEAQLGLLLRLARAVETEPALLGVSAHIMAVGIK